VTAHRIPRDPDAPRHGYTREPHAMPERAHGTASGYTSWGCRCDECRGAWRVYAAGRNWGKKETA